MEGALCYPVLNSNPLRLCDPTVCEQTSHACFCFCCVSERAPAPPRPRHEEREGNYLNVKRERGGGRWFAAVKEEEEDEREKRGEARSCKERLVFLRTVCAAAERRARSGARELIVSEQSQKTHEGSAGMKDFYFDINEFWDSENATKQFIII